MQNILILCLMFLISCGKHETVHNNTFVQPIKDAEPTCEYIYAQSYYDLKLKLKHLKFAYGYDEVRGRLVAAWNSYRDFDTFKEIESCTLLENGKLNEIKTKDVLTEAKKILDKAETDLKNK